jgi:general secretion pathway protein G
MKGEGFTLIELLVCLAVLGVLAVLTVPVVEVVAQRTKENELRIALRDMRNAIDAYKRASDEGRIERKIGQSGYPPSLRALTDGVADQKDPQRSMIYFMRKIPRNPLGDDPTLANEEMWGLRSYASKPDDPKAGDDVFDVYPLSKELGLNGIPYRDW